MAWIESHPELEDHPKVFDLMTHMNWDLDQAIGKIHRFWWWCTKYAEDGDLRKHNDDRMARAVGLNGGNEATRFVDAMVASCWIDRKPYFRVHDWWQYYGYFLMRKYGDSPDKWKRIKGMYVTVQETVQLLSPPSLDVPREPNQTPGARARKRFQTPSAGEVTAYAKTLGFAVDGSHFCDYYQSKGWLVGKTPMRDWKAAVRTWQKNGFSAGEPLLQQAVRGGIKLRPGEDPWATKENE